MGVKTRPARILYVLPKSDAWKQAMMNTVTARWGMVA